MTDENTQAPEETVDEAVESNMPDLGEALSLLDHNDDAHWTKEGKPDCNTLTEIVGAKVSRADVENVAPTFMRQPKASATSEQGEEDGNNAPEEGELATIDDGLGPIDMMQEAIDAATPDFIRFHPSFAQVVQQYQAMLPSIREEQARNKTRGRRFGG